MADGVYPAPSPCALALTHAGERDRLFLVETEDAPDALLKVLGVFAVQQVALAAVAFERRAGGGQMRIEAARLDGERAEHLTARLRSVPIVRGVSIGWRA